MLCLMLLNILCWRTTIHDTGVMLGFFPDYFHWFCCSWHLLAFGNLLQAQPTSQERMEWTARLQLGLIFIFLQIWHIVLGLPTLKTLQYLNSWRQAVDKRLFYMCIVSSDSSKVLKRSLLSSPSLLEVSCKAFSEGMSEYCFCVLVQLCILSCLWVPCLGVKEWWAAARWGPLHFTVCSE